MATWFIVLLELYRSIVELAERREHDSSVFPKYLDVIWDDQVRK